MRGLGTGKEAACLCLPASLSLYHCICWLCEGGGGEQGLDRKKTGRKGGADRGKKIKHTCAFFPSVISPLLLIATSLILAGRKERREAPAHLHACREGRGRGRNLYLTVGFLCSFWATHLFLALAAHWAQLPSPPAFLRLGQIPLPVPPRDRRHHLSALEKCFLPCMPSHTGIFQEKGKRKRGQ